MCTTGVLRLGPDEYLLFKNKDFGRTRFDDRLVLNDDVFGVEGITTWAGQDPDLDQFSGFSIGANRHGLLCCDSNVETVDGLVNYDRATEIALRAGGGIDEAVAALHVAAASRPFMRGNLVMIDASGAAAVELRGSAIEVASGDDRIARTNHHLVFGIEPGDEDRTTTMPRLAAASRRLEAASSVEDIFDLLRSHDHGSTGICSHRLYDTVYSYVLHHLAGATTLHVLQGRPCEGAPRHELPLPLGDLWTEEAGRAFRAGYPSARALVSSAG